MTPEQAKNYKQFVDDLMVALDPDCILKASADVILSRPLHELLHYLSSRGYVVKLEQTESVRLNATRRSLLQLINNKISMKIDNMKIGE